MMDKRLQSFKELLDIMDRLRAECPWDKEQTFQSLRHLTIEETYELCEAILDEDLEEIKNELGDLMLHIVFYAKLGEEKKAFDINDVLESIIKKLIERHPHIFAGVEVKDKREVLDNWEAIKLQNGRKSVLEGVPKSLPAMVKAYRIQEKARGVGFDWEKKSQVWEKVKEEEGELKMAEKINALDKMEDEFGDLLFALINYARFINVNPENALEKTNRKFMKRFKFLEKKTKKLGKNLKEMSLSEMNEIWEEAKSFE